MKNRGFTLIELLVVISIVGLLASIIFVSTQGLRDKAKITKGLEFSQSVQHTLGSQALGWWIFERIEAGKVTDSSGNNNDGTVVGATLVAGLPQLGNALSFNGVSNYVELGNSPNYIFNQNFAEFTVEAWFNSNYWAPWPSDYAMDVLVSKWDREAGNIDKGFRLEKIYGSSYFGFIISSGVDMSGLSAQIPVSKISTGVWHHVVGTFKGGSFIRLYLDGALAAEQTGGIYSQVTAAKNQNLRIGIMSHGYGLFDGLIDEVRIYSQALSSAEIQKHYAEGLEKHDLTLK